MYFATKADPYLCFENVYKNYFALFNSDQPQTTWHTLDTCILSSDPKLPLDSLLNPLLSSGFLDGLLIQHRSSHTCEFLSQQPCARTW